MRPPGRVWLVGFSAIVLCAAALQCAFINAVSCNAAWQQHRAQWTPLLLQHLANTLMIAYVLQSSYKLLFVGGCFYIWFKKWIRNRGRPSLAGKTTEGGAAEPAFEPFVLVQIPMRNERECFKRSIEAACKLDWPQDKLVIQILEDSDDAHMVQLVGDEVDAWHAVGAPIRLLHRTNRTGYKAGALAHGLQDPAVQHCDYVAIFDADFVPARDFLRKTVAKFEGQPRLAVVQARWTYANAHQNLLTRFQSISMSYHFEVEQQVQGEFNEFFAFNGTAGVWRVRALKDAGGWLARTATEDMDLAVRAHMRGWKFLFLNDVTVPSELPSTYQAYCRQQYRWHAGPARLFMLTWRSVLTCPTLNLYQKSSLLVCFFGLRHFVGSISSFLLHSILAPLFALVPEATIPNWFLIYMNLVTALYALRRHKDWRLVVPYFVFENVMHRVKVQGIVGGLLNLSSASVWDVTAKTGVNTDVTTGANIDNKASETGGWTGGRSAPLAPNKPGCPEPLSPAFQRSSENAFEAHSSDQLIAYDSPHCARFDFAAKRRDLGPPSSPVRRGPKSLQRDHSLTSAEEREITLLNSLEADVMRRAKGIPYNLSLVRRIWISVRERLAARKVHLPELGLAVYMLGILAYCVGTGQSGFYFHLGTQGLGYLIAGLGLLG